MFSEDLSLFFDTTNGFAVDVTLKTSGGSTVRTAKGILETPLQDLALLSADVEVQTPTLQLRTTDMASITHDHKIVIGATTYRIVKHLDDGTGITTVWIRV